MNESESGKTPVVSDPPPYVAGHQPPPENAAVSYGTLLYAHVWSSTNGSQLYTSRIYSPIYS